MNNPVWMFALLLLLTLPAGAAMGQQETLGEFAPGFGIVYGEGKAENGADSKRLGFTSRRIKDNDRMGSLALVGEEHVNGVPFELLDATLAAEDVRLRYQSVFMEMKRYFPLDDRFHYYWAIRGGYSRITGTVDPGGGQAVRTFEVDQVAPLALLALPLAIENPGFLLLAVADGTSLGLTWDIVPERLWLDFQFGAVMTPRYRDASLVLEELTIITQTLQLLLVF